MCNTACDVIRVTSREGRVSRNAGLDSQIQGVTVTSREGRVSRNGVVVVLIVVLIRHVPRGTCE